METFLSRFGSLVTAVLSGFDRLVFRGTLIPLVRPRGAHSGEGASKERENLETSLSPELRVEWPDLAVTMSVVLLQ